jgi:hypothetical protein
MNTKSVTFLLLMSGCISACDCLKRKDPKPVPEITYSPTKIISGEEQLAKFQAAKVLSEYKNSHATEIAQLRSEGLDDQGVDRAIMRKHLRTISRHLSRPVIEVFVEATKD